MIFTKNIISRVCTIIPEYQFAETFYVSEKGYIVPTVLFTRGVEILARKSESGTWSLHAKITADGGIRILVFTNTDPNWISCICKAAGQPLDQPGFCSWEMPGNEFMNFINTLA